MENLQPAVVADDTVVSLEYELIVDGDLIDSTENQPPLEYLQGHGNIIPGLEKKLLGMQLGESREVLVPADDGYGEYNAEWVTELEKSLFPAHFPIEIGAPLNMRDQSGRVMRAHITAIGESTVQVDMNHPLAGKDLAFRVTIAGLRAATEDELAAGRVGGSACSTCGSSSGCSGSCS